MLVDSEDMSKVRFICLRRSMPKIAPVFNGAHSNFVVRVFGPNCTSMGGVSYKTESSPITPVKQSLVFLYGMFKLGVDRYVFFRADTDTDYYRSSRPITDILNRYTCLV